MVTKNWIILKKKSRVVISNKLNFQVESLSILVLEVINLKLCQNLMVAKQATYFQQSHYFAFRKLYFNKELLYVVFRDLEERLHFMVVKTEIIFQ